MQKSLKKMLGAVLSLSMIAGTAVIPAVTASADGPTGTITVDGTTATVHATTAAVALVAKYSGGSLSSVTPTEIEADKDVNLTVAEGDKVMLWNKLAGDDGLVPLAEAVTVQATQGPDQPEEPDLEVLKSWKFDFGETAADGWTQVAKDKQLTNAMLDAITGSTDAGTVYGLLGLDADAYLVGNYIDGVQTEEKQQLVMKDGKKSTVESAADDYIAFDKTVEVEGQEDIPGDYPIRFAMNAENNHYYRVKATVTTFDQSKDATVSVFSERRHPILLEEKFTAGETRVVEFIATPQNVYIKGRDGNPNRTYADNLVNVNVVGDNAALASVEVDEVNHQPTIWMYDDSTGCDYAMLQPYFPLQNYGGTGAFITKYLPKGIAISNQGDGGINASDNQHWDAAKANIAAGDYVYVQYGHNHKDDGAVGYLKSLDKYYDKAHSVGAKTLYVGPIDRHNGTQYDADNNKWSSTLNGYSKAAEYYTKLLICGGTDLRDEFINKIKALADGVTKVPDEIYTWADGEIAKGIDSAKGATDVAFVDLNQPTLDWMEGVCKDVKTIRNADKYERNATDYYFRAVKGGGVDGTHCNDAGADNTASFFFSEAQKRVAAADAISKVQAEVLKPLVTNMRTSADNGYVVSEDVVKLGGAPNSAWPTVYTLATPSKYPTAIQNVEFNADGTIKSVTALKQFAEDSMSAYGIVVVTIKNSDGTIKGQFLANDQIDNTVDSEQTITSFRGVDAGGNAKADLALADGDTYTAIVMQALDADQAQGLPLRVDTDADHAYSIVYNPVTITQHYVFAEDGTPVEKFYFTETSYDGETSLVGKNNWAFGGSAVREALLNVVEGDTAEDNMYYAMVSQTATKADGGSGSAYLSKKLGKSDEAMTIGTTGKYMIKAKLSYLSGGGAQFGLQQAIESNGTLKGDGINLFTLGNKGMVTAGGKDAGVINKNKWANVTYILDMDLGKATITVDGYDPVEVDIANYTGITGEIKPASTAYFTISHSKDSPYGLGITDLTIAKLEGGTLPTRTVTVATDNEEQGTVYIDAAGTTEKIVTINETVTLKAEPKIGYDFVGWKDSNGEFIGFSSELAIRAHNTETYTANFEVATVDPITYIYNEAFKTLTVSTLGSAGWSSGDGTLNLDSDATMGNYFYFAVGDRGRDAQYTFKDDELIDGKNGNIAFNFDIKWKPSNNEANQFVIAGENLAYNSGNHNYGYGSGGIVVIKQDKSGATTVNGDAASEVKGNQWYTVNTILNFTDKTFDITITPYGETTPVYTKSGVAFDDTTATKVIKMYILSARNNGSTSLDNIRIFTADQLEN